MRLRVQTLVQARPPEVISGLNEALFKLLQPKFPPNRLLRFDGQRPGDEVHIELSFLGKKQLWVARILAQHFSPEEAFFIDEGKKLPFFLTAWRHKHLAYRSGKHTVLEDDIRFRTPWWMPAPLVWLGFWVQFRARRPIYQQTFGAV